MKIVFIVLSVLVLLFVGLRLVMEFKTWRMKGKNAPTPHKASRKRIRAGEKTVLYFLYAIVWCMQDAGTNSSKHPKAISRCSL